MTWKNKETHAFETHPGMENRFCGAGGLTTTAGTGWTPRARIGLGRGLHWEVGEGAQIRRHPGKEGNVTRGSHTTTHPRQTLDSFPERPCAQWTGEVEHLPEHTLTFNPASILFFPLVLFKPCSVHGTPFLPGPSTVKMKEGDSRSVTLIPQGTQFHRLSHECSLHLLGC